MKNIESNIDSNNFGFSIENADEEYLLELYKNLYQEKEENNTVSFKITGIGEHGFKIKTSGLNGYISFQHMPWKYYNEDTWKIIFPYLADKIFYAKIFDLSWTNNLISLKLDGNIPQFNNYELKINFEYQAIITKKVNYGVFVELGNNFEWESGSIQAMIHKSNFESIKLFNRLREGHIISAYYWGCNVDNQLIFGADKNAKKWVTGEIKNLLGKKVKVQINRITSKEVKFIVDKKYDGYLPITKEIYSEIDYVRLIIARKKLKNQDIIDCEIIGIDTKKRRLKLKWISKEEINNIIARKAVETVFDPHYIRQVPIEERVKNIIVNKLFLIGSIVSVEVIKTGIGSTNKYLVEGKYNGKLLISNDTYRITVKQKENIEHNLQDGDLLKCEVIKVGKKTIMVKWNISDIELSRFIGS